MFKIYFPRGNVGTFSTFFSTVLIEEEGEVAREATPLTISYKN